MEEREIAAGTYNLLELRTSKRKFIPSVKGESIYRILIALGDEKDQESDFPRERIPNEIRATRSIKKLLTILGNE